MDIGLLQFFEKGPSEAEGAILVGLISGLAGAFVAALVGVLSYCGVVRSAKSQIVAAKLMAQTQQRTAKFAGDVQIEAMRIQADLEYRKLHATHVTAERLRWLQDLRLRVAQIFRDVEEQVDLARRPRSLDEGQHGEIQKKLDEISARVQIESNMIWLLLNPKKRPQYLLREAISNAQAFVLSLSSPRGAALANMNQYISYKQSAFDALTEIGVVTWQKVQELK